MDEQSVELTFVGGVKLWWDTELFDASLTRFCHYGCALENRMAVRAAVCNVCGAGVPLGAATRHCNEHDYDICGYCLGHHTLPPVGAKVEPGPTWREETRSSGAESASSRDLAWLARVGIVETELLDAESLESRGDDESKVLATGYHSYFKVRWVKDGNLSYHRGPPFQDVTLACLTALSVDLLEANKQLAQAALRVKRSVTQQPFGSSPTCPMYCKVPPQG